VPVAVKALVMVGGTGAAEMVITKVWGVAEPTELVAESVTLVTPAVVGVPAITPVEELNNKPVGRGEAPKVMGVVPEAVMV
jgi:hypothetical protein